MEFLKDKRGFWLVFFGFVGQFAGQFVGLFYSPI